MKSEGLVSCDGSLIAKSFEILIERSAFLSKHKSCSFWGRQVVNLSGEGFSDSFEAQLRRASTLTLETCANKERVDLARILPRRRHPGQR